MPDAPLGQPHVLVAFVTAANLVDHATGLAQVTGGHQEVWLRDVTAGTTYLVSRADGATGAIANFFSAQPSIDVGPAGPVIAFYSGASNIDGRNEGSIFLRTFNAADTQLVSCRSNLCTGTPTGGHAEDPDVRVVAPANGTLCTSAGHPSGCVLVAFDTADRTITNDPAGRSQVVFALADAGTAATTTGVPTSLFIMSRPDGSGTLLGDGDSTEPSFNADGRALAFLSSAANLTADTLPPGFEQAYMRSLVGSATTLLSRADGAAGAVASGGSRSVALGGDATHLRAAFQATGTNLGSPNGGDLYVRDATAARTTLLNRAAGPAGAPGDVGTGARPAISADGSAALFASSAHNLGDDPAPFARVHVRRLDSGAVELVSRPDGTAPFSSGIADSSLQQGAVSDGGRFVAFGSGSAFAGGVGVGTFQIYVRDLLTGRTILASRASGANGAAADTIAFGGTISGDGRRVVFASTAGNLTPDSTRDVFQVYVRDLVAQTTTLVSRANGPTGSPGPAGSGGATISRDGNVVVFVSNAALDPAGANGRQHVYARDLAAQTTTLVDRDDGAAGTVATSSGFEAVPDADGSRVAWTTLAAFGGAPADGRLHILRRDLASGRTVLVSRADGLAGAPANQDSRTASIDADGDVIAFQSYASNFGETFFNGQIFVRNVAAGQTQLASRASGSSGEISGGAQFAAIDAAGERVAFSASGQLADTPTSTIEVFLRDLSQQRTELVSRADGAAGASADGRSDFMAIDAAGGCVAFSSASTNLGDGFGSFDFDAIHLRAVRGDCPPPEAAPPGGTGPGGGGGARLAAPPAVLRRLAVRPRRFHVGGRRGGTRIAFTLDKAARVTLAFDRLKRGHRAKGRCRARARRGRRCTIATRVGAFTVAGSQGANSVAFSGRLGRRALPRGDYRLTATPVGGRAQTTGFGVVPAPRHRRARR